MFEVEEQKKAIVGAYGIRPVFHIVNDMKGDRPIMGQTNHIRQDSRMIGAAGRPYGFTGPAKTSLKKGNIMLYFLLVLKKAL